MDAIPLHRAETGPVADTQNGAASAPPPPAPRRRWPPWSYEARLERLAARDRYGAERERRRQERRDESARKVMAERAAAADPGPSPTSRRLGRAAAAAVPVVLVNVVAFAGQLAFLRTHLAWPLAGQVLVAVTLESVAVYLAYHAHVALVADDSSLRLRLASYVFALVIAAMNYSHYAAPGWRPTFPAVAFGLMSASSPWLWAVHSRRESRDVLKSRGLIEPHAVRLGGTRWTWHPWRSARVMWHATWAGITDPAEALAAAEVAALPALGLDAEALAAMTGRDRLAVAFGALGALDVPAALAMLAERGASVDQSEAYKLRAAMLDGQARQSRAIGARASGSA